MKRELGSLERALVVSNQHAPFHIASVVQLTDAPAPEILRQSLKVLQAHHPFLSVRLHKEKGRDFFVNIAQHDLPFQVLARSHRDHWTQIAEAELSTRMDVTAGPLFRCAYLFDAAEERGEIILTFFHPIIDASSAAQLVHELLSICASLMEEKTVSVSELPPAPPLESRFPSAFRGFQLSLHTLRYMFQQMAEEMSYRIDTRGKRTPLVHRSPTRGHILHIQFPEELTHALSRRVRQEGITLNSALNAAMMLAVNRRLYSSARIPMRTFTFANLRPYVQPPLRSEELACYISMMRYTVLVEGGMDFWSLARDLHKKIYSSFKSGDKFVASIMAESLMKMVTRFKSFRMGSTALNYSGVVPVRSRYGNIKVTGLHGFISSYDLGPEFSAEAQIFNDQLFWDFMYLDADMSQDEASAIVEEIKSILKSAL